MQDAYDRLRSSYPQLRSLADEIQKAASAIASADTAMQSAAAPTKTRINALGTPPENESRTAASQQIDEFRAPVSGLYVNATSLLNRADDFTRAWDSFDRASDDFREAKNSAKSLLAQEQDMTDNAGHSLSQLQYGGSYH